MPFNPLDHPREGHGRFTFSMRPQGGDINIAEELNPATHAQKLRSVAGVLKGRPQYRGFAIYSDDSTLSITSGTYTEVYPDGSLSNEVTQSLVFRPSEDGDTFEAEALTYIDGVDEEMDSSVMDLDPTRKIQTEEDFFAIADEFVNAVNTEAQTQASELGYR